jgi:hypothetical protein
MAGGDVSRDTGAGRRLEGAGVLEATGAGVLEETGARVHCVARQSILRFRTTCASQPASAGSDRDSEMPHGGPALTHQELS